MEELKNLLIGQYRSIRSHEEFEPEDAQVYREVFAWALKTNEFDDFFEVSPIKDNSMFAQMSALYLGGLLKLKEHEWKPQLESELEQEPDIAGLEGWYEGHYDAPILNLYGDNYVSLEITARSLTFDVPSPRTCSTEWSAPLEGMTLVSRLTSYVETIKAFADFLDWYADLLFEHREVLHEPSYSTWKRNEVKS